MGGGTEEVRQRMDCTRGIEEWREVGERVEEGGGVIREQ